MQKQPVSYVDDIQAMMYASGDCRRPLIESATIVEEIVLKQMVWFIHRAQSVSESRGEQYFDAEDIIFALRSHPVLLSRVIQKLRAKDSASVTKADDDDGPTVVEEGEEGEEEEKDDGGSFLNVVEEKGKRMRFCKKVLEKIDPSGQLQATVLDTKFDPGKTERLRRISAFAAAMDAEEYLRFAEARQASFTKSTSNAIPFGRTGGCASVKKFREWLFGWDGFFKSDSNGFKPSPLTIEMLNMLAYEILATVMDCALLVKRESEIAGFGSKPVDGHNDAVITKQSPLIATSSSQQMALLLSQKLRSKPENANVRYGMDKLVNQAVQPWELREAVRRLRFQLGNSAQTLFENESMTNRVIF